MERLPHPAATGRGHAPAAWDRRWGPEGTGDGRPEVDETAATWRFDSQTLSVGISPRAIAVDETRNRVFVVNQGGASTDTSTGGEKWLRDHLPWVPRSPVANVSNTSGSVPMINEADL